MELKDADIETAFIYSKLKKMSRDELLLDLAFYIKLTQQLESRVEYLSRSRRAEDM